MDKRIVHVAQAPTPVGPYSQGVIMDGWICTSGQVALDPNTGTLVGTNAAAQAEQALRNVETILRAAGASLDQVLKVTLYLTDMDDFSAVNAVYARYFPTNFPARSCVEVSRLPLGALVEIEAMARLTSG
jgi:2-iminobutanoate/2-iminopropanoate deaminase